SHTDHPHPASAVGAWNRHLGRRAHGSEPTPGAVPQEIRPRQLHTERLHPVLVDADHGGPGSGGAGVRVVGRMATPAREASPVAHLPVAIGMGGNHAVPDEYRRLVTDRERTTTLDCAGPPEDDPLQ